MVNGEFIGYAAPRIFSSLFLKTKFVNNKNSDKLITSRLYKTRAEGTEGWSSIKSVACA